MCRNIKNLYNFEPPATEEEILASATQFVRKISGFSKVSEANREVFEAAILEIAASSKNLLDSLVTKAVPKNREAEAEKARLRNRRRFAK